MSHPPKIALPQIVCDDVRPIRRLGGVGRADRRAHGPSGFHRAADQLRIRHYRVRRVNFAACCRLDRDRWMPSQYFYRLCHFVAARSSSSPRCRFRSCRSGSQCSSIALLYGTCPRLLCASRWRPQWAKIFLIPIAITTLAAIMFWVAFDERRYQADSTQAKAAVPV